QALYELVADRAGVDRSALEARVPIGTSGQRHSVVKRAVRWHQQTLKRMGVLEHVDGERGVWQLAQRTRKGLHTPLIGVKLLAFSTNLGAAVWGDCVDVFKSFDEPIHLVVTSPPYCLAKPRAYGNPSQVEYVDFIVRAMEPVVRNLVPGGSICLNVSNDIFAPGSPARSMYCERLLLALHERLGLQLMDRLVWDNPSKAPGPVKWASLERVHLNVSWEPIYWLTNDPARVRADNRRVLEPHTEKHLRLIAAGGEQRTVSYADGAYRLHPGRFGMATDGRIPRNVLTRGHRCADTLRYRADAAALGLPVHGAVMPISIPDFLIRFLTQPDDMVVDPFGGTVKTGKAAERLGRRWCVTDTVLEYLRGGAERFREAAGFHMPHQIEAWPREAA
ncbi:MAG TPA: DNA methyltransferase, partial [Gemmatimonadaceae bacterium]